VQAMLPTYMIPKEIIVLDLLPKNKNGKIDRIALQKEIT
jgi:acyl-coenzyme A synthetase/AMP-(fatty) acid ligase